MTTWKTWSILASLMVATGCGEPKSAYFASGGEIVTPDGDGDDTGTTTLPDDGPPPDMDVDMDVDVDVDDSGDAMDDTGGGDQGFDNPGDIQKAEESSGGLQIDLTDLSGDSNLDQDFYLILVNTGTDAAGYTLRYIPTEEVEEEEGDGGDPTDEGSDGSEPADEGGGDSGPPDEGGGEPGMAPLPLFPHTGASMVRRTTRETREIHRPRFVETTSDGVVVPPPTGSALDETDIAIARRVFRVRRDISDDTECEIIDATLWAIGEHAAIWVDGDVPIDRYFDCADLDEGGFEPSDYDAHGFDNCDLETIVNIVDTNIVPNVTSLLGEPSDEDGNGLVSIVITPVLNAISTTSDDEDDWGTLVESYTDPENDLGDYSSDENPCSDEQEVIYVYAPDPYGHFNPFATVTVDEYTGMDLAGRIVQGMVALVSYNQHVLVNESEAEESWVTKGISAVVTDLLGFGAIFYADAWDYMDAPHLNSLTEGNEADTECDDGEEGDTGGGGGDEGGGDEGGGDEGGEEPPPPSKTGGETEDSVISTAAAGAQYLFFRWLVDAYGEEILADLVQTENVGMCNIEAVTEAELKDLAVAWQVALLTTGEVGEGGADFVDTDTWDLFKSPTLISAPTITPEAGDYYGANGYQRGIDVSGMNLYRDGGTTDDPSEIEENAVKLGNTDYFTFVAGMPFNGYMEGAYGAHVVRVTDIPYTAATLDIQSSSSDLKGVLIRWHDAEGVDYKVENVYSATDANNMPLPDLPEDGSPITGMGTISTAGVTLSMSPEGEEEAVYVYDTDRWLLDLTDRSASDEISVVITVDRRYENTDGDIAPFDLWAAIVPQQFVPSPSVDGTRRGECEDGVDFGYPASMLDYLYYQMFLSPDPGIGGVTGDFDPCGRTLLGDTGALDTAADAPSCGTDWDRDDVLDLDEPRPQTLLEQVMVMQCSMAGGDFSGVEPYQAADLIDQDSMDDNDDPYVDRTRNLGGRSGDSEEEAYLETTLAGGARYVVIVGAGTETGPYELRVKQID
jgi:hypothetical protein